MKLRQLQSQFSRHLLDSSADLSALKITGPFAAQQLMGLYRNNFYIGLSQYLADCFPAVQALVGEEFFAQLAKAYIIECPLTQASLESYGSGFSAFINTCAQAQSLVYLADVAALDWAFDRANSVLSISDFPFARLAEVDDRQQLQICFQLPPETLLIAAQYPLVKIWLGAKNDDLDGVNMSQSDFVILHPDMQNGAQCYSVSAEQFQFLSAVAAGKSLQVLAEQPEFQALLNHFISKNIINDFNFEGEL